MTSSKKENYILFICLAIAVLGYFLWRNRYENIPGFEQLEDSKLFKIHTVFETYRPFSIGLGYPYDTKMMKNKNGELFLLASKERSHDYKSDTLYYAFDPNGITLRLKDSVDFLFTSMYYTKFTSGNDDYDYVVRNKFVRLAKQVNNPEVFHIKNQFYIPWFLDNLGGIFCWNLDESRCSTGDRSAVYYVNLHLKNGEFKIKLPGNEHSSYVTVYYANDPEKDQIVYLQYRNKLIAIESVGPL